MTAATKEQFDVEEIRRELALDYPELVASEGRGGALTLRGSFPVRFQERTLDRFQVLILILDPLFEELPRVWEIGGRVPLAADCHVNGDGSACLQVPEEWSIRPPEERNLRTFLEEPLRNWCLYQMCFEAGESWTLGERPHHLEGLVEAYQEMLGVDKIELILPYLGYLTNEKVMGHWDCPCGSSKIIRRCHVDKIRALQKKIPPTVARRAVKRLGQHIEHYIKSLRE